MKSERDSCHLYEDKMSPISAPLFRDFRKLIDTYLSDIHDVQMVVFFPILY